MESIKLFSLCENLKWTHLPVAGGLYDQHPDLLAQWRYIFSERNRREAEKAKETERKAQANRTGRAPVAGRRRR